MKIVIDIPEEDYKRVSTIVDMGLGTNVDEAIKNGIPLPKGHGRLIDESRAFEIIAKGKEGNKAYFGTVNQDWKVIDMLKTVPTIIEEDKGDKE